MAQILGIISKITGSRILVKIGDVTEMNSVRMNSFLLRYVSVGSLIGTKLVDGRTLVLSVEEILDSDQGIIVTTSISGIYDDALRKFSFGTNTYPLINEKVFALDTSLLKSIFSVKDQGRSTIGTYAYDPNVQVGYNPNILFGKHLGVFGNTGSGKTCTVVSIIQQYIRNNPNKDIKYIILDVNGEYQSAFETDECEYIAFSDLRFHHTILDIPEYGKLFRASEGIQYPALRECIRNLIENSFFPTNDEMWDLTRLPNEIDNWIQNHAYSKNKNSNDKDQFSINQISGYLRSMQLRIDGILNDEELLKVINSTDSEGTLERIKKSNKKVFVLNMQVSSDSLDIVLYLLFKSIYQAKEHRDKKHRDKKHRSHLSLILEEAHRYLNPDVKDTKLGNYYIDKLAREGRKFGIGLIISSQVPSMLSYDIVSQCNSVIMHKITNKRDMEFLRNVLRISSESMYQQMSALEKQYALVCGEAFPSDALVKINNASPLPDSNDPEIGDIQPIADGM